jgi:hypothetical protein
MRTFFLAFGLLIGSGIALAGTAAPKPKKPIEFRDQLAAAVFSADLKQLTVWLPSKRPESYLKQILISPLQTEHPLFGSSEIKFYCIDIQRNGPFLRTVDASARFKVTFVKLPDERYVFRLTRGVNRTGGGTDAACSMNTQPPPEAFPELERLVRSADRAAGRMPPAQ